LCPELPLLPGRIFRSVLPAAFMARFTLSHFTFLMDASRSFLIFSHCKADWSISFCEYPSASSLCGCLNAEWPVQRDRAGMVEVRCASSVAKCSGGDSGTGMVSEDWRSDYQMIVLQAILACCAMHCPPFRSVPFRSILLSATQAHIIVRCSQCQDEYE